MEYSNIVAVGVQYYDPALVISGTPGSVFLEAAAAHEVAHEWFYCQVMSDQIDEPWLDESLVQYATYLYYLDIYGFQPSEGFKASLDQRWERVDKEPIPIEYSAIVYGRGAFFFDALTEVIGQETFKNLMQEYVDAFRWGIADSRDFKALAEEFCGCDLTALFNDWGVAY